MVFETRGRLGGDGIAAGELVGVGVGVDLGGLEAVIGLGWVLWLEGRGLRLVWGSWMHGFVFGGGGGFGKIARVR